MKSCFFFCYTFFLFLCFSTSAHCVTIWVDESSDSASCGCGAVDSCCSLRNAVSVAQPNDTISFDESELSQNTVIVTEGEIVIDKNLIIDGDLDNDGVWDITIEYDHEVSYILDRVLKINDGLIVTIDGVRITGGYPNVGTKDGSGIAIGSSGITFLKNSKITYNGINLPYFSQNYRGGGISNRGILFIDNCTVSYNFAIKGGGIYNTGTGAISITGTTFLGNNSKDSGTDAHGAGIYNDVDATISLNGVEMSQNSILMAESCSSGNDSKGAGIYNLGSMTIINSTIRYNKVEDQTQDDCGVAAGIHNFGEATIRRTYFEYNVSKYKGGAIVNIGDMEILNSTFHDNRSLEGGAIYNYTYLGDHGLDIRNCTFYDNKGTPPSIYLGLAGGGEGEYIYNSIFADDGNPNIVLATAGGVVEDIRQLITDDEGDGWGWYFTNLRLAPPAENGGPTKTCALQRGSPAIGFGFNGFLKAIMTTDQRGQGFPRVIGNSVDCGAFEYSNSTPWSIFLPAILRSSQR